MSDFVNITRNNNDIISTYTNNQKDEGGDEGIAGLAVQLAEKANNNLDLLKRLHLGQVTKIKVIGDSITEGVGATGHVSPPANTGQVIFNDGAGNIFYEAAFTDNTWANLFRTYIQNNFPGVQFTNAGIGGKSSKWANTNKQYWLPNNEDVVFVMLGTNDRWDCADTTEFKTNLSQFLDYVNSRCNLMIVMSPPPAQSDINTGTFHFGTKEVDRVVTDLCLEKNYIHVSNYRNFLRIANQKKLPFNTILQDSSGSHPLDKGYTIIWQSIQQALGFIDSSSNWQDVTPTDIIRSSTFTPNDPIRYYYQDKFTVYLVSASNPNISQLPERNAGMLITFAPSESNLYAWQMYIVSNSSRKYIRTCNGNYDNSWNAWQNISAGSMNLLSGGSIVAATDLTAYPQDLITASLIGSSHPDITNFPEHAAGILITYRFSESTSHSYQDYILWSNPQKRYTRYYTGSAWSAWVGVTSKFNLLVGGNITSTTLLSSFPSDAMSTALIAGNHPDVANFPEGLGGSLLTYSWTESVGYSYQEYTIYQTVRTYKRYWTGSAWSAWTKISAV